MRFTLHLGNDEFVVKRESGAVFHILHVKLSRWGRIVWFFKKLYRRARIKVRGAYARFLR